MVGATEVKPVRRADLCDEADLTPVPILLFVLLLLGMYRYSDPFAPMAVMTLGVSVCSEPIGSIIDNPRCSSVCRDTFPTEAIAKALLCAELTSS